MWQNFGQLHYVSETILNALNNLKTKISWLAKTLRQITYHVTFSTPHLGKSVHLNLNTPLGWISQRKFCPSIKICTLRPSFFPNMASCICALCPTYCISSHFWMRFTLCAQLLSSPHLITRVKQNIVLEYPVSHTHSCLNFHLLLTVSQTLLHAFCAFTHFCTHFPMQFIPHFPCPITHNYQILSHFLSHTLSNTLSRALSNTLSSALSHSLLCAFWMQSHKYILSNHFICFFLMLALPRRTSFWPLSMAYISVIITHVTNYNSSMI
jgi:hypothetical protein